MLGKLKSKPKKNESLKLYPVASSSRKFYGIVKLLKFSKSVSVDT